MNVLFIELKVGRNTLRPTQKEWRDALTAQGYLAVTCWGWQAAQDVLRVFDMGTG